jgi:hypothetical protein
LLATILYIASTLAGLAALAIGIVAVLLGGVALVLAGPDSTPIELPVRPTAIGAAILGLLIFIAAAHFLASVAMLA